MKVSSLFQNFEFRVNILFFFLDKRTANWFLMSSPFYTLGICLSYVYVVKVILFRVDLKKEKENK